MVVGGTEDERRLYRRRSNPLSWRLLPTPSTQARANSLPNSPHQGKNSSDIQRSVGKEAYLVARAIRTGVLQTIDIPPPIPTNDPDVDDLTIVIVEVVRAVAKRLITLNQDLKKGFATVYHQCSQEVRYKLESSDGWETVLTDQSLHELILKIEPICVGFDDHKQEV